MRIQQTSNLTGNEHSVQQIALLALTIDAHAPPSLKHKLESDKYIIDIWIGAMSKEGLRSETDHSKACLATRYE